MNRLAHSWKWFVLIALGVFAAATASSVHGSDISKGYSFSPNDHVVSSKLNGLIDNAVVNTTFATDKSAAQPLAADTIVYYQSSSGAWRKTTFDQFLLSNTNLIVGQIAGTPTTNDFFLYYSGSAGTFMKVPLDGLLTNLWLIPNRTLFTNSPLQEQGKLLVYTTDPVMGSGTFSITWSNLFAYWWRDERFSTNVGSTSPLTNPPIASIHTALTNADMIRLWDAAGQTNRFTTLVGLITNLPASRPGLTNLDTFMFLQTRTNSVNPYGTNAVVSKMTLADLFTNYLQLADGTVTSTDTLLVWSTGTNASSTATNFPAKVKMSSLIQKFYTNGIPISGTSLIAQGLHGLSGTPQILQWYLICTNAGGDGNYVQGDVVTINHFEDNAGTAVPLAGGANATQVFLTKRVANLRVADKNSTSALAITASRWNAACEAIFYP